MLGFWQIIIILVIVILLFGPSRIEKLGPSLGRAIRGFKKGMNGEEDEPETKIVKKEDDSNQKSS